MALVAGLGVRAARYHPVLGRAALALAAACACVHVTDRCESDSNCDPGRRCVAGRCRPADRVAPFDGSATGRGMGGVNSAGEIPSSDAPPGAVERGGTSEAAPGWSPGLLPGLALWLDASLGVTAGSDDTVSSWRDQSGRGNDAIAGDAGSRPKASRGGANGSPLVLFGSSQAPQSVFVRVPDAPTLRWGTGPFAVILVAASENHTALPGLLFRKRGPDPTASRLELMAEGPGDGRLQASLRPDLAPYETIAQHLTNGRPFAFAVRRTVAGVLELRVNGQPNGRVLGPQVLVDISAPGADIVLGAGADQDPPCCQLSGGIAEVIGVEGDLSDDDLSRVETYLRDKYGLP
jgi:hypothetical protein